MGVVALESGRRAPPTGTRLSAMKQAGFVRLPEADRGRSTALVGAMRASSVASVAYGWILLITPRIRLSHPSSNVLDEVCDCAYSLELHSS